MTLGSRVATRIANLSHTPAQYLPAFLFWSRKKMIIPKTVSTLVWTGNGFVSQLDSFRSRRPSTQRQSALSFHNLLHQKGLPPNWVRSCNSGRGPYRWQSCCRRPEMGSFRNSARTLRNRLPPKPLPLDWLRSCNPTLPLKNGFVSPFPPTPQNSFRPSLDAHHVNV
jgi:hypothetical protein